MEQKEVLYIYPWFWFYFTIYMQLLTLIFTKKPVCISSKIFSVFISMET